MHCELLVPALFPVRDRMRETLGALRLPALELLLARGRRADLESGSLERWLLDASGCEDAPLAAGALTALADGAPDAEGGFWSRADPVHLRVDRDRLTLVPATSFALDTQEASTLCDALNAHFAPRIRFFASQAKRWCARLEEARGPQAAPAIEIAGEDVNAQLPAGEDSRRWHALLNEIQMVLHEHPVNEARERRGVAPVNSVWLWGPGALPAEAHSRWRSVSAHDPVALGLARLTGTPQQSPTEDARQWLAQAPEDGRHLIVLDLLREPYALGDALAYREGLQVLEGRWFAPLLAALRRGRIGMITVHVPDGDEACAFETIRGDLRRFWRIARPLASYA